MGELYDPQLSIRGLGSNALVLVPGINGSGHIYHRQLSLLEHTYRVATYSLRDEADQFDTLVEDLARVIDQAAPIERRTTLVGESFGGAVALSFALKYPERVAALVILNSFPRFTRQFRLKLAMAGLTVLPRHTMPLARRATARRLHSPQTPRSEIKRFLTLTATTTHEGYINRLRLLRTYDVRSRLHELRMPTLFLAAERDHLVPSVREAQYMAARVPTSAFRILPGHGHICLIAPDLDLAKIIGDWKAAGPNTA